MLLFFKRRHLEFVEQRETRFQLLVFKNNSASGGGEGGKPVFLGWGVPPKPSNLDPYDVYEVKKHCQKMIRCEICFSKIIW